MSSFRTFFSEMIRHERKRVLAGLACAFVSAGGLGGGVLALAPKFRGTFGVFRRSNGQLSRPDRQAMGVRQV